MYIKILTADQMRWLDNETIKLEPIASVDLMERAGNALCDQLMFDFEDAPRFVVVCGKGNNGGDGLVLSRLLLNRFKKVQTYIPNDLAHASADFFINLKRLKDFPNADIKPYAEWTEVSKMDILVDAIFGTGLNKPVTGDYKEIIDKMNQSGATCISVDINSGLSCDLDENTQIASYSVVRSKLTYCLDAPKMSLLHAETGFFCDKVVVVDIGLHAASKQQIASSSYFITSNILKELPDRPRFAYKNTFGHVLAIAGSKGKSGAAYLCGKAAMEVGAGLVTVASCNYCNSILQTNFPEAMTLADLGEDFINKKPIVSDAYSVLAIGPGIGTHPQTVKQTVSFLTHWHKPLVVDADALNCISEATDFKWPINAILTPHPGEFDRLTRKHTNSYERQKTQIEFSKKHQVIVVLKGAYTVVSLPNGEVFFNSSGTAAMAKAGSGDVLTGIIAGFLAQGLAPHMAAKLGVYIHGLAGEQAELVKGKYSVNATDIIENIHICLT